MKRAFLLAAALLSAPVAADEPLVFNGLQFVDTVTKDGYVRGVFFNVDSVRRHKDYVRAWVMTVNSDTGGMVNIDGIGYTRALMVFNCRAKSVAVKAYADYTAAHRLVDSHETDSRKLTFDSTVPASIGESLLNAVCKKGESI